MSAFGTPIKDFSGVRGATSHSSGSLNVPSGALIIVGVTAGNPGATPVLSVSDTTGNTYTARGLNTNGAAQVWQQFFYCLAATADAANVITGASTSSANWLDLAVWVVPLSSAATFDSDALHGSGSGGTMTSATFNTSGSDEFAACFIDDGGFGSGGFSANNGWTTDSASYGTFDAACHTTFSSPQVGITGSMSNGGGSSGAALAIAFKAGGSPPPSSGAPVVVIMQ
jgi:hypothetical protein